MGPSNLLIVQVRRYGVLVQVKHSGYSRHRENRENGPKNSLSGKTQGILSKYRDFLFVQVVNALILKVKYIAIFAAKIKLFFPEAG